MENKQKLKTALFCSLRDVSFRIFKFMGDHEEPRNARGKKCESNSHKVLESILPAAFANSPPHSKASIHVCLWANPNGRQPCWHIFICPTSPAALGAGIGSQVPTEGLSLARHVGKLLCNSKMRQTMDGQTRTPRTGPRPASWAKKRTSEGGGRQEP